MMDKKSANGFQTKASEGGVQRKQLPYSVETPYGFHLDLDFLKYVDDIEKGNTIKRVHIQRRIKGPPKFSTLPRNFSLPGHGIRPVPKETAWSGTSTLGPKPKSRVTEVQQIFDFRPSEGGTSSQSGRVTPGQGSSYVPAKPREDIAGGARDVEEKAGGIQNRPNLLRASSMPITLQQRKGSDSSSPDRAVGTPEGGLTENMFRASPDITERRCVPQDRTGLHQQITVALKRVRELEEQVKTIPELKAQICSLREEREQLLLQLQAQTKAKVTALSSTDLTSSESRTHAKPQGHRPSEGLTLDLTTQPTGGLGESKKQIHPLDKQKETLEGPLNHAVQKLLQDTERQEVKALKEGETSSVSDGYAATDGKLEDSETQKLRERLMILEAKLSRASQDLERTNNLLKEQLEENKMKEEKILQLSEGVRVEICSPDFDNRPRRVSIDAGTETEKIDVANQETETESPGTVDQGTDTDRICIEVCIPIPMTESTDQGKETSQVQTQEQVTEIAAELAAGSPPRPRANSMERGTVTERIPTQDQMTETPVAERVNQVTETEGETVTNHPHRPRASSVDRGTETERVSTVDRVTETEVAQRTDQQTGTETDRRPHNNPCRGAEAEGEVRVDAGSERQEDVGAVVNEREEDKEATERIQRDKEEKESVDIQVVVESSVAVTESKAEQVVVPDNVSPAEGQTSEAVIARESAEYKNEKDVAVAENDSERKETVAPESEVKDIVEPQKTAPETVEKKQFVDAEIVHAVIKETVVTEKAVVEPEKTAAPVRPQRGRKFSAEQVQPLPLQPQVAPVRPRRGSSEAQKPQAKTQPQVQAKGPPQPDTPTSAQVIEPEVKETPSLTQVEEPSIAKKPPEEKQPQPKPQPETKTPLPGPSEVQIRPKSIQTHPQTTAARRDSKEIKVALQKGSSVSRPSSRVSGEAQTQPTRQASIDTQPQTQVSRRSSGETQLPGKEASETKVLRKGSTETVQRRGSGEAKAPRRDSGESQTPRRGSGDTVLRRGSSEAQATRKDSVDAQATRRGSGETAQRRGSSEAQTSRKDSGEAPRRGSSESPTSPAALGQVVTRLTGLLGEQWAQLGSGSGTQQTASQQESPNTLKQTAGKRAEAGKGATAKPAGKAAPTASTGKPAGKPGPSKMSSIQSQLVSSLSVLSAFYSPGQKASAASKQQEQGLKSIMKKDGVADKQGNKGAKKNLKFVGVNGGYETTSSEESSGDEKSKVEVEEEDSSEPEVEKEKETEPQQAEKPEEGAESQQTGSEAAAEAGGAVAAEKESERGLLDPDDSQLLDDPAEREKVDKGFLDACVYVKDRMEEVSSPDKEMRQVLVVLYKEWFKVSSQKDSQADTVRLYLRQVGLTTPTLLPYVVNLTDGNGNMALHYSVSHSNFPVVKLLLDTGLCETDNVNKAGYTPVMLAALTAAESPDDLEVAQQLLRLGDVNACSRQAGQTALMLAVSHGRVAMVKLLLSCGADVNAQDREGSTALMCASEHGHMHIVRLLLETGRCDTSLTDKNGQTALVVAEGASHKDIVDLLKAHAETGASSDPSSSTGLL
ncbi:KN motif and ankyrin repeat domain-containing protein 2 [Cheilinus undulatus]|uniref:KN motif and ankyrin repeat domain-containing protein 2 n=1 Tax=Cheilinus undulatus TaxID=241271 RepID=UPI001BD57AD5|nr:KN motif and ankyrin repeat domain-containing protein 2 [Cheilinus undulatus]XP_041646732.1 KN motif and ankyrin repeat domain-containing protein 2 [Cheilinus undulatus]XP_041646733.1 KN motif and ankyrin repeat domain-containing protein 2 [Cheilinus undulatus]XP_041646734.1 KN motif and ankyrin repeat domain-containing protein 2 [Cheilinus undulatus]XP_041646735.1 KN motif and ankyrin repeat domain-containing protein 2 [Cheilinus undulatus]XP_041646736.1 KN motif and ankyrin repeat domain-